jgi:hypothetical protein
MNTDNVLLVILLVLGIVILSNLAMFAVVRGSRDIKFDWLKQLRTGVDQPFRDEKLPLEELRQRVEELDTNEEN